MFLDLQLWWSVLIYPIRLYLYLISISWLTFFSTPNAWAIDRTSTVVPSLDGLVRGIVHAVNIPSGSSTQPLHFSLCIVSLPSRVLVVVCRGRWRGLSRHWDQCKNGKLTQF